MASGGGRAMDKKLIIVLAIIFFLIGGISAKILSSSFASNHVSSINVEETIDYMTVNNPVKIMLEAKVNEIEMKKAEEEEKRRLEEAKLEEKRRLEEKRLEEEKKLEEAKRQEEKKAQEKEQLEKRDLKVAYLTFDDGPSKTVTPKILDILAEYDIKATFFVIGKMVDVNPDILKRIYEEGHSIGNHSYSHNYSKVYKDMDSFLGELISADNAIKRVLGEDFETKLLRFPGGSHAEYKKKFVKKAEELGYKIYDWNALNGDAEGQLLSKDKLIQRLKSTIKGQKKLIILMHDTDAKTTTVDALPEIIDYLKSEGYSFEKLE